MSIKELTVPPINIRKDLRLSGQVTRYHTWPRLREQSTGEHSWQLCRLILTICPQRAVTLLPHAVVHDCGENGSGDIPFPVKHQNPVLKSEMDRIEGEYLAAQLGYWDVATQPPLSLQDHHVFKLLELIEMWEWGIEEELRGNRFAALVTERCWDGIIHALGDITDEWLVLRVRDYTDKRKEIWNVE